MPGNEDMRVSYVKIKQKAKARKLPKDRKRIIFSTLLINNN